MITNNPKESHVSDTTVLDEQPEELAADEVAIAPFAATLQAIHDGRLVRECAEKLHELITAVGEQAKQGTFTLLLTVAPLTKGDASTVTVAPKITVKAPEADPPKAVFYAHEGHLMRDDPAKAELPGLRRVDVAQTVRKVAAK